VTERLYPPGVTITRDPVDAPFKPTNQHELAFFLHNQLQIEFVAIDIAMRNISDFADLPLTFYVDQARHAHDEVRHTQMLLRELSECGADVTSFPFEVPDRFAMMIGMSLVDRLIILSRTGESEAIEAAQIVIPHLFEQRMDNVAGMLENVLYDETRHTWYGNKWLRWLQGDDDKRVDEATARALTGYNVALAETGSRMPPRDPDYTHWMAQRRGEIDPLLRAHAGFTEEEVAIMRGLRHWPA
jgi:uncharacterized ferritin-like protein (DUF455 family)